MADITLEDALTALNNGIATTAATDAQLKDYYVELINANGEAVDKQPLSRLNDMVLNYALTDGLEAIAEGVKQYQPIEFERFYKTVSRMMLGSQVTRNGEQLETGTAKLSETNSIMGMTFVWNQLFDGANKTVQTINGATYYCRINGVEEVFTSDGTATYERTSETAKDMLINLTHLYGANPLNLPLTMEQFKELFPLAADSNGYYDYSEPRLMHTCVTQLQSSGKDKDGNVFTTNVNLPIQQLTGKLNGEGESVVVFPDGMAGASYPDYIYKEDGVWKAVVRNRRVNNFNLSGRTFNKQEYAYWTILSLDSADDVYDGSNTINHSVCDYYISIGLNSLRYSEGHKGFVSVIYAGGGNRNRVYISDIDYLGGNLPTINFAYSLRYPTTYILDDEWQTVFDEVWQTSYQGNESVYPINGTSPTTAPVRLNVEYPVLDYEVKRICVENWGGEYFDGEITPAEAAKVTTLGDKFYNNDVIETFGELKYFTGLTTLFLRLESKWPIGAFNSCASLGKVVMPPSLTDIRGAFRYCDKLTTIINNVADWSVFVDFTRTFNFCSSITIITGTITGISENLTFQYSPLTVASALVILNGLAEVSSTKTLTLKASMQSTYEADADFNVAVTSARAKGWEIAYA